MKNAYIESTKKVKYEEFIYDQITGECLMCSVVGDDEYIKYLSKNVRKSTSINVDNAVDDLRTLRNQRVFLSLKPSYDKIYKKMPKSSIAQLALIRRDKFDENLKELTCLLMVKSTEDLNSMVFDKLYKNTAIPLLENWMSYIVSSLIGSNKLRRISVIYGHEQDEEINNRHMAYKLCVKQEELLKIIQDGIRNGSISVAENTNVSPLMESTTGLDSYLNLYGDILAERIQSSFVPKFNPDTDDFSEYVNNYDDACYHNGVELYNGQKVAMQAAVNALEKDDAVFIIGEMGIGSCVIL